MYYEFRKDKLDSELKKNKGLRRLIVSKLKTMPCPYDGITFYTDRSITPEFFKLVKPAMFSLADVDRRYQYSLKHKRFTVLWAPLSSDIPQTIIRLNPHKNKYSPAQVLDLISFIVGDNSDVYVGKFDEKVDLPDYTVEDVVKRLHVPYKRKKPNDYKNRKETFYFGSSKSQQVKVYNKGKQQGLNKKLVRIERTTKYKKTKRPTAVDFFLNNRQDVLKQLVLVDTDKIDNRTAIKKELKKFSTFFEAYKEFDDKKKRELKRHPAFLQPLIDIQRVFLDELKKWLETSPQLSYKLKSDQIKLAIDAYWSKRQGYQKVKGLSHIVGLITGYTSPSNTNMLEMAGWGSNHSNHFIGAVIDFEKLALPI